MKNIIVIRKKCPLCGSKRLEKVVDLGETPLANAFIEKKDAHKEEPNFPLALNFCNDCTSVQLSHVVSPELLFKNYHYATSASQPLVDHFNILADEIADKHVDSADHLVIEIGSNDGSLLARIKDRVKVLGIDPADNIAVLAEKNGVPTKIGFFGTKLAEDLKPEIGQAKVIVANNVMAHIDDLQDVFMGVKNLLAPDGTFIFEVHWVGNLLTLGGFDQIYHEHLYYHSLHALGNLLDSIGMVVKDVKLVPIHGESLRVYAGKTGTVSQAVWDLLDREVKMGLTEPSTYTHFSGKIETNKAKLMELLKKLKAEGKKLVGYGAPGKGNTLLNYFGIGPETLDYITDTTPAKQGTETPGMRIPVVSPDVLKEEKPDYIVLLSWNYADAILEKEKALRKAGVKFIIPVPEVRVV